MLWGLSEVVEFVKSIKSSKIFPVLHSAILCAEMTALSCLYHCMASVEADDKWRKILKKKKKLWSSQHTCLFLLGGKAVVFVLVFPSLSTSHSLGDSACTAPRLILKSHSPIYD
jgi:Na+/proline symporter